MHSHSVVGSPAKRIIEVATIRTDMFFRQISIGATLPVSKNARLIAKLIKAQPNK